MPDILIDHATLMAWAGAVSGVLFIGTLLAMPFLVVRLPPDYFVRRRRGRGRWRREHPVAGWMLLVLKNAFGAMLLFAGTIMLVTPGQGLLTMLCGLILMDYPGKYRVERWLITRRSVWRTIHWLRERAHAVPLKRPQPAASAGM